MRLDLPSGTVTFLFTDVESSTRLLHELGAEAYAEALAEHRRVIREACIAEDGVEVDTQGDAFFFAFPTASAACAAACAFTEELAPGSIQVRVGLHTGTPLLTDEGYVGDDVHFAARVASSGHGGQVVVSPTTATIVETPLTELGEHRLRDIEQAVPLYQLGEGTFPPLKTISNTNLPTPASSFLGRERELAETLARIEQGARLLTLTGPGGAGKTRLAIEAAFSLVGAYKAGVFWIGLASLRDPALVTETISQTLGARDGLAEHIAERELLLLLDNLEQVIEAAPALSALLQACPNLTLLVTSRELLRVQGEVEYSVPPLAEPEAVSLFCERAQREPSEEISALCARLDSLPLAVELAAARTKALSPAQILKRLSGRLDLLEGGRDADPRQLTLRATIEWSYDLLSPDEQALFARLSVFAGGCTLQAAEEVAGAELDTMQSLVEKSLLRFSNERFWMLETIREYAGERLGESPEQDRIRVLHAEHCLRLAEGSRRHLRGPAQGVWLERLRRDEDNLRAALTWTIERGEAFLALSLAFALEVFWVRALRRGEAESWLDRALQLEYPKQPIVRARALGTGGLFATSPDVRAARYAASIPVLREQGDDEGLAFALRGLSWHFEGVGELSNARAALKEAIELFEKLGHTVTTRLVGLGVLAFKEGDHNEARRQLQRALATGEDEGDAIGRLDAFRALGMVELAEGDLDEAERVYRGALDTASRLRGDDVVVVLAELTGVLLRRGVAAEAGELWGRAEHLAIGADSSIRDHLEQNEPKLTELSAEARTAFLHARASAATGVTSS